MAELSRRHSEILALVTPMFSLPDKDEFGHNQRHKSDPLAFDRINEGRPPSSEFMLTRLPIELSWAVVKVIDETDLASLALVNRDCRQFARSRQFSSVTLDYSDKSLRLLMALAGELRERAQGQGSTQSPAIGPCIRHLKLAVDAKWFLIRHGVDTHSLQGFEAQRRLDEASTFFFDKYIPTIVSVICSHSVLPHLELLDWHWHGAIGKRFLEAITLTRIHHLRLRRIELDGEFNLDIKPNECTWRLKSLFVDIISTRLPHPIGTGSSPLISKLLSLAAPTLESLTWKCYPGDVETMLEDCVDGRPEFLKLQDLCISEYTKYDPAWLEVLILPDERSRLRCLEMNLDRNDAVDAFFRRCGSLPQLETFVWQGISYRRYFDLTFFRANPHIRKFLLTFQLGSEFMSNELLPLLCTFPQLTSLSLKWEDHHIPEEALAQICTMKNLEQLCLSSGSQAGWRRTWLNQHDAIQRRISDLHRLRKLVFCRETYRPLDPDNMIDPGEYYDKTSPDFLDDFGRYEEEELFIIWEDQHKERMSEICETYATILPHLDWIYVGEIPFAIKQGDDGGIEVVALSERDSCTTLLGRMFGREDPSPYI